MSNPIDTLAILGGQPAFPEGIAIIRPCMDEIVDEVLPDVEHILRSNMLTNVNQWVPRFEQGWRPASVSSTQSPSRPAPPA